VRVWCVPPRQSRVSHNQCPQLASNNRAHSCLGTAPLPLAIVAAVVARAPLSCACCVVVTRRCRGVCFWVVRARSRDVLSHRVLESPPRVSPSGRACFRGQYAKDLCLRGVIHDVMWGIWQRLRASQMPRSRPVAAIRVGLRVGHAASTRCRRCHRGAHVSSLTWLFKGACTPPPTCWACTTLRMSAS
jgi:hypothetical protein